MTDTERADRLAELLRGQLGHFSQTRDLEFKVNMGLWAAVVAAGGVLYNSGLRLHSAGEILVFFAVALGLWLAHTVFWMVPIQYSEDMDAHFIQQYRRDIMDLCGFQAAKPDHSPFWSAYGRIRKSSWAWVVAETGITMALTSVVGLALIFGPPKSGEPRGCRYELIFSRRAANDRDLTIDATFQSLSSRFTSNPTSS